jgi:hypothetical protein
LESILCELQCTNCEMIGYSTFDKSDELTE